MLFVVRVRVGCLLPFSDCPAAYRRAWLAYSGFVGAGATCGQLRGGPPRARPPTAAPPRGRASEPEARPERDGPQVARPKRGRASPAVPGRHPSHVNELAKRLRRARRRVPLPRLGCFPFTCPARFDRWRWLMPAPSLFSPRSYGPVGAPEVRP